MNESKSLLSAWHRQKLWTCLAAVLLIPSGLPAVAAVRMQPNAVSSTVTNCNDSGPGSLRDAAEQIVNTVDVDLTQLSCSTITLTSGPLDINALHLSLRGPGAGRLTVSGGGTQRVVYGYYDGNISVQDLTIAGGNITDDNRPLGGCVYTRGDLSLESSVVTGCIAENSTNGSYAAAGGAVFALGNVSLTSSTVSGNVAYSQSGCCNALGGGIYAARGLEMSASTLTNNLAVAVGSTHNYGFGGAAKVNGGAYIEHSTISNNTAQGSSGVLIVGQSGEPSTIFETTISDNTSTRSTGQDTGALYSRGSNLYISNSTITGNTEANATNTKYGAGLNMASGTDATVQSVIIAGNTLSSSNGDLEDDVGPNGLILGSNNLIEFSQISVPSDTINTDPMLAPLADNGGPTKTHALMAGSPAIDEGINQYSDADDQRGPGYPRVVGSAADIGAVEYNPLSDDIFRDGFEAGA